MRKLRIRGDKASKDLLESTHFQGINVFDLTAVAEVRENVDCDWTFNIIFAFIHMSICSSLFATGRGDFRAIAAARSKKGLPW